jgi:catechol 2,3-dioxygenase-like lactoylglutathione lyase family enzyme
MKVKSVSGFTIYVKDLEKTVEFYTMLGFDFKKQDTFSATGYMNWYSINFIDASKEDKQEFLKEAHAEIRGMGIFINLSVDDVDEAYKELVSKGIKPSSEPRDWPWGNREFVLRDPDGYKLVFFKKK